MKVGIVDSGAGGLTILNAIHEKLPYLDLVYLADDAFAPYGSKSHDALKSRLVSIVSFFEQEQVSAIVVACNTATVTGIDEMRASTTLPIIGVEPAVKPALNLSQNQRVTVLATPVTASSSRLKHLIDLWRQDAYVDVMSSDSLAFDIDDWPESESKVIETVQLISQQIESKNTDTLVLACTHYPLIKPIFERFLGSYCNIIEPSDGVVSQVFYRLNTLNADELTKLDARQSVGSITLCSTAGLKNIAKLAFWITNSSAIKAQKHISL